MVTVFATWRETCGNGAAIGIGQTTIKLWPIRATWRTIRKARSHHLILPNPTRKSACIVAARSFAMNNIAHATSLARAAKVRSTPAQITLVFDASDRLRILRNKKRKIRFLIKGPLIKLNAKRELQLPRRIEEGWICFALQGRSEEHTSELQSTLE